MESIRALEFGCRGIESHERFVRGKGGLPENGLEKQLPSAECPGLRKILPHRFDLRALRANHN